MADPLATYPLARKWAEKFYAVKGWGALGAPPGSPGLEKRRTDALAAIGTIAVGRDFLPEVRRAFDGGIKTLRKAANDGTAEGDFDVIDADILALKNDVAAQGAIAAGRIAASAALATAEGRFKAATGLCEEGGLRFLEGKIKAARAAFGAAKDAATFDDARKLAAAFPAQADAAEAHARTFALWVDAAIVLLMQYPPGVDRDTADGNRIAARNAAEAKARAGDFAGAKGELDAFPGDAKAPDFTAAQAFFAKLNEYEANAADCTAALHRKIEGSSTYDKHAKTGKEAGLKNKNYAVGTQKLTDLLTWCLPRKDLGARLATYATAMERHQAYRDAVALMNTDQKAGRFVQALGQLDAIDNDPALASEKNSWKISSTLKGDRLKALLDRLPEPFKSRLQTAWDTHEDLVGKKDFAKAKAEADRIEKYFELEAVFPLKAEADAIFARSPDTKSYDYLKTYSTEGKAGRYANARKEIEAAMPLLRRLEVWLGDKAKAAVLLAALPPAPPDLRADLDKAVNDADAKAKAGNPEGAINDLAGFLKGAGYATILAEIEDWQAKDAALAKRHARVVQLVGRDQVSAPLGAALADARKPATDRLAYTESFLELVRHEAVLAAAQDFAAVRRQVMGVQGGILKAAKKDPAILDPAPATEEALDKAVKEAEALAQALKFAEAAKAFAKVRTDCEALARKAAATFEEKDQDDKTGLVSNAGHSLDRHGPDVSHPDLIRRLKTGTPPNNKTLEEKSYTGASSKFASPQDWLAGRQLAAEAAERQGIDLDAKSIMPPFDDKPIAADFTVDHGRPIDEIFLGLTKNRKQDPTTGEMVDDSTYESYQEMSGLTRAYVNFIWEFPVIKNVDWPDPKTGVVAKKDVKARDIDEYAKAWRIDKGHAADGPEMPPSIPGRWVMMQQYPVADNWDDVAKTYTKDPKGLIP